MERAELLWELNDLVDDQGAHSESSFKDSESIGSWRTGLEETEQSSENGESDWSRSWDYLTWRSQRELEDKGNGMVRRRRRLKVPERRQCHSLEI